MSVWNFGNSAKGKAGAYWLIASGPNPVRKHGILDAYPAVQDLLQVMSCRQVEPSFAAFEQNPDE